MRCSSTTKQQFNLVFKNFPLKLDKEKTGKESKYYDKKV